MTIYTPSQNDKDKAKLIPEVVTDSLANLKDESDEIPQPRLLQVTFFRRNGKAFYIYLLLALALFVVVACGALGTVVFYRHLHKKVYSGKCGTVYFDTNFHRDLEKPVAQPIKGKGPASPPMGYLEEDISVMEDFYEELHTPAFDEVRESYVRHNFKLNFTAVVDHDIKRCFILPLNRSAIALPRNVIELIQMGLRARRLMMRAPVIRQDFAVSFRLDDLTGFGKRIAEDCGPYATFQLEKRISGIFKRSVPDSRDVLEEAAYAMLSNEPSGQTIYKIFIHNMAAAMGARGPAMAA